MAVTEEYSNAIKCYEHILSKNFTSREIYNNLGALYLLKAINLHTLQLKPTGEYIYGGYSCSSCSSFNLLLSIHSVILNSFFIINQR